MKTAKVFEIHCWNEEQEWITFVLRYGKLKDDVFQGCHYGTENYYKLVKER